MTVRNWSELLAGMSSPRQRPVFTCFTRPFTHAPMRRTRLFFAALLCCACSSEPESPKDPIAKGDFLLARGDTSGAQAAYRLALGQDSLNADLLARMGRIYASQGKAEPADVYLRRAADLTFRRGLTALQTGDRQAARAAFAHTLAIIPAHPLALLQLGDLSLLSDEDAKALEYFEQAIEANPDYAEGYTKAGKLYLRQRRFAEAERAFETSIELNINSADAYLGLGELFQLQQNPSAAAEQYRKVLLIDPRSPLALAALTRLSSHP